MENKATNKIKRDEILERIKGKERLITPVLPEAGYTPANLRYLRGFFNLTQKEMAFLVDASARSVQNWEADPQVRSHRVMPIGKWRLLIGLISSVK